MANAVDLSLLRWPACAAAPPPPLQLTVLPRSVRIGTVTSFRFTVRASSNGALRAVPGAAVVFNHHRTVTNSSGRASFRLRLTRTGTYRAVATAPGHASAVSSVHVRR